MDTILKLRDKIGEENLSTQAKKRITAFLSGSEKFKNFKAIYENADEDEKLELKPKFDEWVEYFEDLEEDTISFLEDEIEDKKLNKEEEEEEEEEEQGKPKNKSKKDSKKKKSGLGGVFLGVLFAVASFGAVKYFKNSK